MLNSLIHKTLKNIPVSAVELIEAIGQMQFGRAYQSPHMKLVELQKHGEIIRLKKGLYVVDSTDFGFPPSAPICSNHIYGPSYLSLQWALAYYGLIPERVSVYTATTIKRTRVFENALGRFTYFQVGRSYFPIGITTAVFDQASCLIATPEKALIDLIMADTAVPSSSQRLLAQYLEEDLRLDMDELAHLDISILQQCANCGRKVAVINNLIKIIRKL